MRWRDVVEPIRMTRVAVVAPTARTREALSLLAGTGAVQLDDPVDPVPDGPAATALHRLGGTAAPARLTASAPDISALASAERRDLLGGEAELERFASGGLADREVIAWVGWCPAERTAELTAVLAPVDSAVVPLRRPAGTDPPTLLTPGTALRRSFAPLVQTYGTVPYRDLDPTVPAGLAYVAMFGMMFADAGHGLLLLLAAVALRAGRPRRLAGVRRMWPFVAGAGAASAAFGVLFGEFFGPTGVLDVRWLSPLDEPVRLLAAGVGVGAALLAVAYLMGVINRWREGGLRLALYAPSGVAGAALFAGLGALAAGLYLGRVAVATVGALTALVALVLAGIGIYATSGGGGAGATQTGVQLFDLTIRLASNVVSFARLAAFGLTHAALGALVWTGTTALWRQGGAVPALAAVLLVLFGNAVTFALEALVAGVQALRLEYYELFSRVFEGEGSPFRPWHVPTEEANR